MSALLAFAAAAAIVCTLDFAVTGMLNEAGLPIGGGTPCDARNNESRVYRGTSRVAEIETFNTTGHILSDAAQEKYLVTGSLVQAYSSAAVTHSQWNSIWGNELFHAQAHGVFGIEMERVFGMKRSFVSVTRNLQTARNFAGPGGRVYTAIVPRWGDGPTGFSGCR